MDLQRQWETLKTDHRTPLIALVVIVVLLIYYLYCLAGDFTLDTAALSADSRVVHIQRVPQVSQWHIFGRYDDSNEVLPITRLQLTLQGIMLSPGNQKSSSVIIQSPTVPAKVYKVGDEIPGDATLEKIQKDRVVLQYQGTLQSLLLPRPKLTFSTERHR